MIQLKQLLDMYCNGVLNIKYESDKAVAILGNTQITMQQAEIVCKNLGWDEIALNPFEIIDKTKRFVGGLKRSLTNPVIWDTAVVSFSNVKSAKEYNKTFDRIHMQYGRNREVSILYRMPGNSTTYVVFDSFTSVPVAKCKSLKQVGEYLNTSL